MKQESNNAIDLMLRKLGRSGSRVKQNSGNGASESNEAHLDVDELNAYAENAIPATTRARYTQHLADCARCRHIVSQLSEAAGVVLDDAPKTLPISGLKAFLASLFSPIVLRYAVPALGLLIVASIGFVALRQRGSMELAQKREVSQFDRATTPTPGETGATSPTAPSVNFPTKSQPQSARTPQEVNKNEQTKVAEGDVQAKLADDARQQDKEQAREKTPTSTDQIAVATPANSPTVSTGAGTTKPAVADQKQAAEVAENKVQAPAPQAEYGQNAAKDQPVARRVAKEPPSTIAGLRSASGLKKGKADGAATESVNVKESEEKRERGRSDRDEAEITSVAGHRFRKTGSVWIDVAYTSSQSTTNIKRESEQYRALIADEPGIRKVAEQLSGEVIVVWKGRAYRIR